MRVAGLASNSARVWSVGSRAACGGTLRGEGCGTALLTTGRPLTPVGEVSGFLRSFPDVARAERSLLNKQQNPKIRPVQVATKSCKLV
jgi:hypothetical protein